MAFVDVYDGTQVGDLKCLAEPAYYTGSVREHQGYQALTFDQLSYAESLSPGCAVVVDGTLVLSPQGATQDFELQCSCLRVIGGVDSPLTYPIQKSTEKHLASLRHLPFMRFRSQATQCLFRIQSKLAFAVHAFMDAHDVQLVDPSVITTSDCEGAGETFSITPQMFSKDHDGKQIPVGLAVSSQLPLEAAILGFKQVYTCQKSFRAEKSDTVKHLAEFLHVEYEGAFCDLQGLLSFTEHFVKYLITYVHSRCKDDFDWFESKFSPRDLRPTRQLLT